MTNTSKQHITLYRNRLLILIFLFTHVLCYAQNPHRYDREVAQFDKLLIPTGETVVFTGSSSIRKWTSLTHCNGREVVNTGFGGSHMSDLLFHLEKAIFRFRPSIIYIYEGDNDIASGKKPSEVLYTAQNVVNKIKARLPYAKIYFIGAKPCPSRWKYREGYLTFNNMLERYCEHHEQLHYIDVWNKMLVNGYPNANIFISDNLHLNDMGYRLWNKIICNSSEE